MSRGRGATAGTPRRWGRRPGWSSDVGGESDPGGAYDVVWQSRSGPPRVPWLAPDINDHLAALAARGVPGVVVSPVGFVSDHVEVRWDLDHEARQTAERLGLPYARAATVGVHPRFVAMVRELVEERRSGGPRLALGPDGPGHDTCPAGCCPAPARPAAPPAGSARPAASGSAASGSAGAG